MFESFVEAELRKHTADHCVVISNDIFLLEIQEKVLKYLFNFVFKASSNFHNILLLYNWCYYIITLFVFSYTINPAVTATETGRGAETARGAESAGGAGRTADGGGPTENQSRRAEG